MSSFELPVFVKHLHFAAADEQSRYMLDHIAIRNGYAYATNGKVLARIRLDTDVKYPEVLFHSDVLRYAERKKHDKTFPKITLEESCVTVQHKGEAQFAEVPTTPMAGGNYPPVEEVIPKPGSRETITVRLNPKLLMALAKALDSESYLRLEIPTSGKGTAVAKPMGGIEGDGIIMLIDEV